MFLKEPPVKGFPNLLEDIPGLLRVGCQEVEAASARVNEVRAAQVQAVQELLHHMLCEQFQVQGAGPQALKGGPVRDVVDEVLHAREVAAHQEIAGLGAVGDDLFGEAARRRPFVEEIEVQGSGDGGRGFEVVVQGNIGIGFGPIRKVSGFRRHGGEEAFQAVEEVLNGVAGLGQGLEVIGEALEEDIVIGGLEAPGRILGIELPGQVGVVAQVQRRVGVEGGRRPV